MTSHELAKILESAPDLPIVLSVYGHEYSSVHHRQSHGPLRVMVGQNNYGVTCVWLVATAGEISKHLSTLAVDE